jgi:ankyrin repeat protein
MRMQGRLQVSWPTTPLIVAAKMGHTEMVALLMDRGANVQGVSKVRLCYQPPAHCSSSSMLPRIQPIVHACVICLRSEVLTVSVLPPVTPRACMACCVSLSLQTSRTALHEAALTGHADVVAEMLRRGTDHDMPLPVSPRLFG